MYIYFTIKNYEMKKEQDLALVKASDLSMVKHSLLNESQLKLLLAKTPKKYIHKRPAKGGGQWDYVTGGYMKKVLNLMFGWDWDFEITKDTVHIEAGQVIIMGKLTVRVDTGLRVVSIIKQQYGRADIKFRKNSKIPLDLGNDMKAAATDGLKKCAAELGIAADIYNKLDFQEMRVGEVSKEMVAELFFTVSEHLTNEDSANIERVIKEEEESSYQKAYNHLLKFKTK